MTFLPRISFWRRYETHESTRIVQLHSISTPFCHTEVNVTSLQCNRSIGGQLIQGESIHPRRNRPRGSFVLGQMDRGSIHPRTGGQGRLYPWVHVSYDTGKHDSLEGSKLARKFPFSTQGCSNPFKKFRDCPKPRKFMRHKNF